MIITNDAHSPDKLLGGLDQGVEYIKSCGFDEVLVMTEQGFRGMKI